MKMTKLKIANMAALLLLLVWFTVFITGLSFGGIVLAERDFDFITILWWVLYMGCVVLFFANRKIGQYVCAVFQFVWIITQGLNFFASPEGIKRYNELFANTHSIIQPSNTFLIPDTAHLILFALLLCSFALTLMTIILPKARKRKRGTRNC